MIKIAAHNVGPGHPCFIIAEAGVNHNGDLSLALKLVDAASNAGADAVKFQTFKAEALVSPQAPKASYQMETTDPSESQFEMIQRLELSLYMHQQLIDYCEQRGILFMSSAFDHDSADLLESIDAAVYKIPSGELTNIPFLRHVALKGKPMIVSTGMAYLGEVDDAVRTIYSYGNEQLILLHCVSNYPADPKDINLAAIGTLDTAFGIPIGYSDHTEGIDIAIGAVAIGAKVIEKHITLDRSLPGPDHKASIEPQEFKDMVDSIRRVEQAIGTGKKIPADSERDTSEVARKSLVACVDIEKGSVVSTDMIAAMRPGTGLSPVVIDDLIGRVAKSYIPYGELITWDMFA